MSLLALAAGYGYVVERSVPVRWFMVLAMVPLAIISNGLRIMITAIMAHYIGPQAAEGFMHEFSGWVIFVVATVLFLALHSLITYIRKKLGWYDGAGNPDLAPAKVANEGGRTLLVDDSGAAWSHGRTGPSFARRVDAAGDAACRSSPRRSALGRMVTSGRWTRKRSTSLKVTDYLNRGYWEPGMNKNLLGLYIGYFRSQRTGATIHSPKNCLPGAGWNPAQSGIYQLQLDDGRKVPINLYLIRKGLESRGGAVLVPVAWPRHRQRILGKILFSV